MISGGILIAVTDDGPGIEEDLLPTIFDPFSRGDSSRSANTGGAGLGFSIARRIVQAHGGDIVLRNRRPNGLTAEIRLPR